MELFVALKGFLRGKQSTASTFEELVDRIDVTATVMRTGEG